MALGEYDFKEAEVVGRAYAFTFYIGFMVLVVMVMLAMLIAIVLDVYVEVKSHSQRSDPLWTEVYHILRRLWMNYKKTRLPLEVIRAKLDASSNEVLFVDTFRARVPGLREAQATRLVTESIRMFQAYYHEEPDNLDVKAFTDDVIRKLRKVVGSHMLHSELSADEEEVVEACGFETRESEIRDSADVVLEEVPGGEGNDEERAFNIDAATRATSLEAMTIQDLLQVAALKLEDTGCQVPAYEGSAQAIQQVLRSAQGIAGALAHSVTI